MDIEDKANNQLEKAKIRSRSQKIGSACADLNERKEISQKITRLNQSVKKTIRPDTKIIQTNQNSLCDNCESCQFMGVIAWGRPLTEVEANLNKTLEKAGELYVCQEDGKYMPKEKPKPTKSCEEIQEGEI